MLIEVHPSVWVLEKPFLFLGQDIGSRMTIVRLRNGNLWVHSPVQITQEEVDEVKKLGVVIDIVAPNLMHYLFLKDFVKHYPTAKLFGPAGIEAKIPDIDFTVLSSSPPNPWDSELRYLAMSGMSELNELVFLHEESGTLILTDLALHIQKTSGPVATLFARMNQSYKTFGPSRICKLYIDDQEKLKASLSKVLEWDFETIIVSHGDIVKREGKKKLTSAYQWLSGRALLPDRILGKVWAATRSRR